MSLNLQKGNNLQKRREAELKEIDGPYGLLAEVKEKRKRGHFRERREPVNFKAVLVVKKSTFTEYKGGTCVNVSKKGGKKRRYRAFKKSPTNNKNINWAKGHYDRNPGKPTGGKKKRWMDREGLDRPNRLVHKRAKKKGLVRDTKKTPSKRKKRDQTQAKRQKKKQAKKKTAGTETQIADIYQTKTKPEK